MRLTLDFGSKKIPFENMSIRFSVDLAPGPRILRLPSGALKIDVPEGCRVCGACFIEGGQNFALRSFRAEFTKPPLLQNPMQALLELYQYHSGLSDGPFNEWVRGLRKKKTPVTVYLDAVEMVSTEDTVRPAFTGRLALGTGLLFPFSRVVLPNAVLPGVRFSASSLKVEELLSSKTKWSFESFLQFLGAFEFDFSAKANPPALALIWQSADRTKLQARVLSEADNMTIEGQAKGRFSRKSILFESGALEVSATGERPVTLKFKGVLKPNLESLKKTTFSGFFSFGKGFTFPALLLSTSRTHPLAKGQFALALRTKISEAKGTIRASYAKGHWRLMPYGPGISAKAQIEVLKEECFLRDEDRVSIFLDSTKAQVSVKPFGKGYACLTRGKGLLRVTSATRLSPLPELRVKDPFLSLRCACAIQWQGKLRVGRYVQVLGETSIKFRSFSMGLDGRSVSVPSGTQVSLVLKPFVFGSEAATGFVYWDLRGKPLIFEGAGKQLRLKTKEVLRGETSFQVSPAGRVSLVGKRTLEAVGFLNTFLAPASRPANLLAILDSEETTEFVTGVMSIFNPDLAQTFRTFLRWVRIAKARLAKAGSLAEILTSEGLARALSLLLTGDEKLKEKLLEVVETALQGRGIRAADFLHEIEGFERFGYEVTGALRWLDLVLRVSEPLPLAKPVYAKPLALDPAYEEARKGFPSANQILEIAQSEAPVFELQKWVAQASTRMTLGQVEQLLSLVRGKWDHKLIRFIERVLEAKKRVAQIEQEGYGGLAHAGQAAAIASLIGEGVGPLQTLGEQAGNGLQAFLGPSEVAVLLQAGLSQPRQGTQAQINNRLLLEYIKSQPPDFTKEVLLEMAHGVESALASVLFAFLHQDQDRLKEPLDLAAFLEERLEVEVPRMEDFLAGGKRARDSYFEALSNLASRIRHDAPRLQARKQHIQEFRHPPPRRLKIDRKLEEEAKKAISLADNAGFKAVEGVKDEREAAAAYERAFEICAEVLRECKEAFSLAWFKEFWARNEEALRVWSVVRAYEEDQDQVRRWLYKISGKKSFWCRHDLIDTIIDALWARPEDREKLRRDPLVRLLIPVPEGHLNFTIIGCMGVITDGQYGHELEDAFRRLEERRGVEVIRAHTGLFRSLEYNAVQVISAIKRTKTPYGLLGYSQGCANALMAEHLLRSGTLEEQRLLERLVCRNLLFSAANGSVHGTSGERKLVRALIEGEKFLKHYQATHSREAARLLLRLLRSVLDSPTFLKTVAGAHSLTIERAAALHRDGQFCFDVPTSTTRGVATLERLPQALLYLYYCHEALLPGAEHDSQVATEEAVGRASRVINEWTKGLARCDMPSMPLLMHHWAPVTVEVERLTTAQDVERAVYQCPKDIFVFPWVEVNTRFGRIAFKT